MIEHDVDEQLVGPGDSGSLMGSIVKHAEDDDQRTSYGEMSGKKGTR